ncbi:MAG TPA: RNA-binding protein [Bacteroidetes bacterium]|nr:RNA-binding protein [Bacteroidota bacterium]
MEELELTEIFKGYGSVNTVTIITDKVTGESQGYGFIEMSDRAGAEQAIKALDDATIDERKISVRIADDTKRAASKVFTTKATDPPGYAKVEKTPVAAKKKRPRIPR